MGQIEKNFTKFEFTCRFQEIFPTAWKGVFEVRKLRSYFGGIRSSVNKGYIDRYRRVGPKVKTVYKEFKEGEHDEILICLFVINFMFQCLYFFKYWG